VKDVFAKCLLGLAVLAAAIIAFIAIGEKQIDGPISEIVKALEAHKGKSGKCPASLAAIGFPDVLKANGFDVPLDLYGGDSANCSLEYFWGSQMRKYSTKTRKWDLEHY
jgi:hypothetical protein